MIVQPVVEPMDRSTALHLGPGQQNTRPALHRPLVALDLLGDAAHEPDHGVPVAGEPLHAAPGAVHQTRGHLGKGEKFLYSQL